MFRARSLVLAALLALASAPPASAGGPPRIFLTWGAPYGAPGARESIVAACGDTTTRDS